jgi:hypothetical protein
MPKPGSISVITEIPYAFDRKENICLMSACTEFDGPQVGMFFILVSSKLSEKLGDEVPLIITDYRMGTVGTVRRINDMQSELVLHPVPLDTVPVAYGDLDKPRNALIYGFEAAIRNIYREQGIDGHDEIKTIGGARRVGIFLDQCLKEKVLKNPAMHDAIEKRYPNGPESDGRTGP